MQQYFKDTAEKRAFIQKEFNRRLANWYAVVAEDYGVVGSGTGYFDDNPREINPGYVVFDFHVYYEEDGVKFHSLFSATDEQLFENRVDWLFDIWSEGSMPTTKEAKPETAETNH